MKGSFFQSHHKELPEVHNNGTRKEDSSFLDKPKLSLLSESLHCGTIVPEYSKAKIEELFARYKDEQEDAILAEGMESFCNDLCVDPTEFVVLVLAWKFQAATMCKFTRKEFVNGCMELQADNIKAIQSQFPELVNEVRKEEKFKELYRFTFQFGLDSEGGQRSLPTEIAVALWRLIFTHNPPAILESWLRFLNSSPAIKGISRDTWNMFLNFSQVVGSDLTSYSEDEAWPSLFDAFVEWEMDCRKKAPNSAEKDCEQNVVTETDSQD